MSRTPLAAALGLALLSAAAHPGSVRADARLPEGGDAYEVFGGVPGVQAASVAVLRARGYTVSVRSGSGSGRTVVGKKSTTFGVDAPTDKTGSRQWWASHRMETVSVVEVHLSPGGEGAGRGRATRVLITGDRFIWRSAESNREKVSLTASFAAHLREEIRRAVAGPSDGVPAQN